MHRRTMLTLTGGSAAIGVAALTLGALPAGTEATAPLGATAFSGATAYLSRPEGRLAYDDRGAGRLVVMVPGLGDVRGEYRKLVPELVDAGFRVVTMDIRGHGQSSTGWSDYTSAALGGDVVALVRELGAGPAILVGTSMGAAAVAWAAAEAPDAVGGVALIGPFVRDVPPASWWQGAIQAVMINVGLAGPWGPSMWGSYYGSLYGEAPDDIDAYRQALVANLKEPGRMDALHGMMAASKADVAARLHEVKAPVLVVMGTADPDFPDPAAEAGIVAELLGGEVLMVDGAGHYPQVEQPELVAGKLIDFVSRRAV